MCVDVFQFSSSSADYKTYTSSLFLYFYVEYPSVFRKLELANSVITINNSISIGNMNLSLCPCHSSTTGEEFDEPNPLLISPIFHNVLQHLPTTQLKDVRLVCRSWWKESLAVWRRTKWLKVRINNPDLNSKPKNSVLIETVLSYLNEADDPFHLEKIPFQKYHFFKSKISFLSTDGIRNEILDTFCKRFGPLVKELRIEKCTIETKADFHQIVFRLSPNLQYLSLTDNVYKTKCNDKNQLRNVERLIENKEDVQSSLTHFKLGMVDFRPTDDDLLPLSWTELFAHFPNIRTLELAKLPKNNVQNALQDICNSIYALRVDCGILTNLCELDLLNLRSNPKVELDLPLMAPILNNTFPLTFLAYELTSQCVDIGNLALLLGIASITLQTLIICKFQFSDPLGDFPYGNNFPNLTKLKLVGPIATNLHFLEHMPNLNCLWVLNGFDDSLIKSILSNLEILNRFQRETQYCDMVLEKLVEKVDVVANTDFERMNHLTFPKMEELIVGMDTKYCSALQLNDLSRLMPNLKKIRVRLDGKGVQALSEHWKRME